LSKILARSKKPQQAEPPEPAELIVVMGCIAGPFGVSGWIRVFPYTENVDGLLDYPVWWLGTGDGDWRKHRVLASEVHGRTLVALLEQYDDRTAAMQLKGLQIGVPRSQLPALPESGEEGYYWSDLIGFGVVNVLGEELGVVTGLLETGANDVLQLRNPKEADAERLVPFISEIIVKVDLKAARITVDWSLDY
jgi:16S rRNA processing protein RimM